MAPIFHPKKHSFFEISLSNLTEAAMAVKESAGDRPRPVRGKNIRMGWSLQKKTEAVEKHGKLFFF